MHKLSIALFALLMLVGCQKHKGGFIYTQKSAYSYEQTLSKLNDAIANQGLTLYTQIDHKALAAQKKANLHPSNLLFFGNSYSEAKLIRCNPTIALDLPLRIEVRSDYEGIVWVDYVNPEYWSLKHNVKDKSCLKLLDQAKLVLQNLSQSVAK